MAKSTKHYESGKGRGKAKVWGPGSQASVPKGKQWYDWQEASTPLDVANTAGKGINAIFLMSGDGAWKYSSDPKGTRRYDAPDYNEAMKNVQASVTNAARWKNKNYKGFRGPDLSPRTAGKFGVDYY